MYSEIIYEVDDPVATITLNRPDQLNAWTNTMAVEVQDAFGRAERDPAVVGIVLTGAGRGFCAGADMNLLTDLSGGGSGDGLTGDDDDAAPTTSERPGDASWGEDFRGAYTYLMSVPKPVIAAINGPIAGMAVPIALCCDLRFMAPDAVLTVAFSQRGLIGEWGVSWLLPRLIGPAAALDLLYSSRRVTGIEAQELGLANKVVPAESLLAEARAYVEHLAASCSPASMAVMKRQVYEQLHAGLGAAERDASRLMIESFGRPDFAEGVQSFLAKRPPQFARIGDTPDA